MKAYTEVMLDEFAKV